MNKRELKTFDEMIADEEDGYNKYMTMSRDSSDDPAISQIFLMMAEDELKHKKALEMLMEVL